MTHNQNFTSAIIQIYLISPNDFVDIQVHLRKIEDHEKVFYSCNLLQKVKPLSILDSLYIQWNIWIFSFCLNLKNPASQNIRTFKDLKYRIVNIFRKVYSFWCSILCLGSFCTNCYATAQVLCYGRPECFDSSPQLRLSSGKAGWLASQVQ